MTPDRRHTTPLEAIRMNWPIIVTGIGLLVGGWRAWESMGEAVAQNAKRVDTVEAAVKDIAASQQQLAQSVEAIVNSAKEAQMKAKDEEIARLKADLADSKRKKK